AGVKSHGGQSELNVQDRGVQSRLRSRTPNPVGLRPDDLLDVGDAIRKGRTSVIRGEHDRVAVFLGLESPLAIGLSAKRLLTRLAVNLVMNHRMRICSAVQMEVPPLEEVIPWEVRTRVRVVAAMEDAVDVDVTGETLQAVPDLLVGKVPNGDVVLVAPFCRTESRDLKRRNRVDVVPL